MKRAGDVRPGDIIAVDVGAVNGHGRPKPVHRVHRDEGVVWFDYLGHLSLCAHEHDPVVGGIVQSSYYRAPATESLRCSPEEAAENDRRMSAGKNPQ